MTYHQKKDTKAFLPDDIKTCLKSLSVAWGGSLGDSSGTVEESREVRAMPVKSLPFLNRLQSIVAIPDSQLVPLNRSSSPRASTPLSSPLDVFSSPRRHSSAPPSSPSNPFLSDNVGHRPRSISRPREDRNNTTPARLSLPSSSNSRNVSASTPRANADDDTPEIFKGRKRTSGLEFPIESTPPKRRRSEANAHALKGSVLWNTPRAIEKALSEPAPELSSPLVLDSHLGSQPNPARKRKLFEYLDLPLLRNVRARPVLDNHPVTPERWIEPTASQQRPLKSQHEVSFNEDYMHQKSHRGSCP